MHQVRRHVAVIGMPQHRLNLCAEHFVEWVPDMVERTIDKYGHVRRRDERILVAVSGGKDSLGLWDILIRLGYRDRGRLHPPGHRPRGLLGRLGGQGARPLPRERGSSPSAW
jgi:hypothetical protein